MITRINTYDKLMGTALSAGSKVAYAVKPIGKNVSGHGKNGVTPLIWHLSPFPFNADPGWRSFDGSSTAGRTPVDYPEAAVFTLDSGLIDKYKDRFEGQQAVAYLLGKTAVMVGAQPDELDIFGPCEADASQSTVAMRIGKGVLTASVGLMTPINSFVAIPKAIQEVQRLPLSEVNPQTPIV